MRIPGSSLPRLSSHYFGVVPSGEGPAEGVRLVSDSSCAPLPSVQHECIPQAILGMDILCQAKSGMGKTAVFVLATLQQIEPVSGQVGGHHSLLGPNFLMQQESWVLLLKILVPTSSLWTFKIKYGT